MAGIGCHRALGIGAIGKCEDVVEAAYPERMEALEERLARIKRPASLVLRKVCKQ